MKKALKILAAIVLGVIVGIWTLPDSIQVVERNSTGVFTLQTNGKNQFKSTIRLETIDGMFYCSAAVLDANYALTAAHCVTNTVGNISDEPIAIYDVMGVNTGIVAKPVAIDKYRDTALIKGDFMNFEPAPADFKGDDVTTGMTMRSCGFPSGEALYCTDLVHVGNHYFQYKTIGGPIFKGMSGGPVYSITTGRIIGVNSAVTEDNVIISPLVGFLGQVGF